MKNTLLKTLRLSTLTMTLFFFIVGCGEDDSNSSQVTIEPAHDSPKVFQGGRTILLPGHTDEEPKTKEITGPWFRTGFSFSNGTEHKLVISDFNAEITAPNGTKKDSSPELPDGQFYLTEPFLDPGENRSPTILFYFDSLPTESDNSDNFKYRVKIEFIGFFLAADAQDDFNPIERFSKTIRFTTE